jgi:hypothetical protein
VRPAKFVSITWAFPLVCTMIQSALATPSSYSLAPAEGIWGVNLTVAENRFEPSFTLGSVQS